MRKPESGMLAESARSLLQRALDLAASPLGRLQSGPGDDRTEAGATARRGVALAAAAAFGLAAGWQVWPTVSRPGEGPAHVAA